jgi:hypothetical protein
MSHMMKIHPLSLVFALGMFYMGCSSASGPLFKPITDIPGDQSLIYLYRPDDGKSTEFTIKCNNKEIGILENKGYFPLCVEEGKVEISSLVRFKLFVVGLLDRAIAQPTEFVFKAEPGRAYYIECLADESEGKKLSINLVPDNYGFVRIKECRLLPGGGS